MWGALLAAATAGWLHQLTAERSDDDTRIIAGHGVDGGKAMIATLRRRLVAVPGRVVRHARPPPDQTTPHTRPVEPAPTRRDSRANGDPTGRNPCLTRSTSPIKNTGTAYSRNRV